MIYDGRFTKGMKVVMTSAAIGQHLQGRNNKRTGTVTSPKTPSGMVGVLRDGSTQREYYHPSFWQPL